MQKGAARSAAVLQGVFPNGAVATGSMGQNLFLEGRDLGKGTISPLALGDTCPALNQCLVFQSCVYPTENMSWIWKAPVEDTGNIPLPLMGWQPWTEVSILLIDCVFLLLTPTRRSSNAPQLPC